jgi:hypothetical protein
MNMKLEIDSERVLQLARKCPKWKEGLSELFPDVFRPEKSMKLEDWKIEAPDDKYESIKITHKGHSIIWIGRRDENEKFRLQSFYDISDPEFDLKNGKVYISNG